MLVFPEDANRFKIRLNINTKQFTFNIVVNRVKQHNSLRHGNGVHERKFTSI